MFSYPRNTERHAASPHFEAAGPAQTIAEMKVAASTLCAATDLINAIIASLVKIDSRGQGARDENSPWKALEKCIIKFIDPTAGPGAALVMHPEPGMATLASGRPAKRFVTSRAGVSCLVVPDYATGMPRVVFGEGAPPSRFQVMRDMEQA